jgi:F-type H+-transporting ATPase subunit b
VKTLVLALALAGFGLAQEHPPAAEHKQESHGAAEPDLTNWKWANFAILAAGLGFLIAKNAGPYFAGRGSEIRKGLDEARQMRAEADARAAAMEQKLANLGAAIEALRQHGRAEAAAEAERLHKETEREAAKIQEHAGREITSALKAAQAELQRHAAGLAIELARKKIQDRMSPADQDALIGEFIAGMRSKN